VHPARFAAVAAALTLTACAGGGPGGQSSRASVPAPSEPNQVVIYDYKFYPPTLTVPVGTTVSWINHDTAPHTATHRSYTVEPFDTGELPNGQVYRHTFQTAGSYAYICIYHQGMQGTIVVQ